MGRFCCAEAIVCLYVRDTGEVCNGEIASQNLIPLASLPNMWVTVIDITVDLLPGHCARALTVVKMYRQNCEAQQDSLEVLPGAIYVKAGGKLTYRLLLVQARMVCPATPMSFAIIITTPPTSSSGRAPGAAVPRRSRPHHYLPCYLTQSTTPLTRTCGWCSCGSNDLCCSLVSSVRSGAPFHLGSHASHFLNPSEV